MKIWYDTEFLEEGSQYPIDLISIGMVREDGEKLYLFNGEFLLGKLRNNEWMRKHVVPHLPTKGVSNYWWDESDPRVVSRTDLRWKIKRFVLGVTNPELWAYYAAYDHVVLAQLFGTMVELPSTFPMWTNDLQQLATQMNKDLIPQTGKEHDALADALWCRDAHLELIRATD